MAAVKFKFEFDERSLPDNLHDNAAQEALVDAVKTMVGDAGGNGTDPAFAAAIVGMLVLDGYTDPKAPNFENAFWVVRGEAAGTTKDSKGSAVPNRTVYDEVAAQISKYPGHHKKVYYQELASVSRALLKNTDDVPYDKPGFINQIRVKDDEYAAAGPEGETLDLPDLDTEDGAGADDIKADNIQAVAMIYAAYQLEQVRLFQVVDRITELFMNGQLPIGSDRGGRALDDYYWTSEDRLSESARHMQYSRVLGAAGGEVSQDVVPNSQFDDLWLRFVSTIAQYENQQRIGELVGNQRANALTISGEQVRQAGRNLAANASLAGWGGSGFSARRLGRHINKAMKILNTSEIQSAFGVDGPWKVVERVSTTEFGASPNIVKYKTMAEAGKTILDIVAKYAAFWAGSSKPLFADPGVQASSGLATAISEGITQGLGGIFNQVTSGGSSPTPAPTAGTVTAAPSATNLHAIMAGATSGSGNPGSGGNSPGNPGYADISTSDQNMLIRQAGNWLVVNGIKDDQVDQYSQPAETQYAPTIPSMPPSAPTGSNGAGGIDQLRQMVSQGQVPSLDELKNLVLPPAH
jgi:hypothetical protein